jgi:hypothetical protein
VHAISYAIPRRSSFQIRSKFTHKTLAVLGTVTAAIKAVSAMLILATILTITAVRSGVQSLALMLSMWELEVV